MKKVQMSDLKKKLFRKKTIIMTIVTLAVIALIVIAAEILDGSVITLKNSNHDAGVVSGGGRKADGATATIRAIPYNGYYFVNWTNEDGTEASREKVHRMQVPESNITLTANWGIIQYSVTLHLDSDTNTTDYSALFEEGTAVTTQGTTVTFEDAFNVQTPTFYFDNPTRDGWTFLGWFMDEDFEEEAPDSVPQGSYQNVIMYAKWAPSYNITYNLNDGGKASNNPANPATYTEYNSVSLEMPVWYEVKDGVLTGGSYQFLCWKDHSTGVEITRIDKELKRDIVLDAYWDTSKAVYYTVSEKDGKTYVDLGHFPNHILSDGKTVKYLKDHIHYEDADGNVLLNGDGTLQADPVTGWYTYNNTQYALAVANPYYERYYYSDNSLVVKNNVDFFIVEPIKWRVIKGDPNTSENVLLLSEYILNASAFQHDATVHSYLGIPAYANNWERSDVRTWLNGTFYASAFRMGEAAFIQSTKVDYSAATGHYDKFANGTYCNDNVYLLSYADMANRKYGWSHWTIDEDNRRKSQTTDYARALGAYSSINRGAEHNCGHWWLRSAGDFENSASLTTALGTVATYNVSEKAIGIRPAINVVLN